MPWFKLDCQFPIDDKIRGVTPVTRYSVICIFCYVKAFGTRGEVNADAHQIAAYCQMEPAQIAEALRLPIFNYNGKTVQVVNWQRYNDDPTGAERQKRYRQKQDDSDARNALRPLRNAVTVEERRGEENRGEREEGSPAENCAFKPNHTGPEITHDEAQVFAAWCEHIGKTEFDITSSHRDKILGAVKTNIGIYGKDGILEIIRKSKTKTPFLGVAITAHQQQERQAPKLKPGEGRPICKVCRQPGGSLVNTSMGMVHPSCRNKEQT